MSLLLDTNVISELRKPPSRVDPAVRRWASEPHVVYVSVVTLMEVETGVLRVERRDALQGGVLRTWFEEELLPDLAGWVLPVDTAVARRAASLHVPDPRPQLDCLIGATALVHDLTVVTRNVRDFEPLGVRVLDPWAGPV